MFLVAFVFVITIACVWFVQKYPEYKRRQKLLQAVPGPKPWFFIGSALDVSTPVKLVPQFYKWKKEYGDIVRVHVGPDTQYVISDVNLLEYITTSNTLLNKADFYRYLHSWLGSGLLTATAQKWRKHRKIITPTFHFKILEQFIEVFDSTGKILVNKLEKECGNPTFDIYNYITLCTLDAICETAMGVSLNSQDTSDTDYINGVRFMMKTFMERTYSLKDQYDWLYMFTSKYRKEVKSLKILHEFTDSVIRNRRKELVENTENNHDVDLDFGKKKKMAFLDLLLQATVDGKPLTDKQIREEVDTFMFEGHDTTASATSYTLYCLAKYPEVQKKAVEELDSIFFGDKERPATYAELQGMKYLEMVIKEVQRVHPTVPFVGREVTEDFTFGDYTFVKGCTLILFFYGAHLDAKNFPNPEKFDPGRWMTESDRNVFSFLPFSAGPRNCIGQKFAMLELKSLLSKILRNYELLPATPHHEVIMSSEGVLKSANGIRISIKKRK